MTRPSILIVDDEVIIARDLETRLEAMGYEVAGIASSGSEAIRLATDLRPSLVLMDIVLKGEIDGIAAAAEIRRRCGIPVIYVTAYADAKTLERAKVTEPFAYLVKPFSERELNANIEMAFYKHRTEQRLRRLERWFGVAVSDIADAVVAADSEGRITAFNQAAGVITGWEGDQAIGKRFADVVRIVDRSNGQPIELEGITDGPVVRLASDTCLRTRSGRHLPVDVTTSCIRDDLDRPSGIVSVFRDASGQRNAALVALNGEIAVAAAQDLSLRDMLHACTESLVRHLNVAFARIWTLDQAGENLELQASSGMYTHLDGAHGRVPVGKLKIGRIAKERRPHLTNDVLRDERVSDPAWARREGMVSFAGYPLLVNERLVGVMAMFSRQTMQESVLGALSFVANAVAVAIERKVTEAERDGLLAMLRMQIERMPLAYVLLDGDHRIQDWNPAAEKMFGYTKNEVLGHDPFDDLAPPSERDRLRTLVQGLHADDKGAHSINQNRTKDGRTITCEWLNTPLTNPDGKVIGVLCLAEDITERQKLEDEVHQARQRLEAIVASSPAVLYRLAGPNPESLELTWIGENVTEMLGYGLDDVMKPMWWQERVHPEDLPAVSAQIGTELLSGGRLAQEYRFRHQNGAYRWVRSEMRLLRGVAAHLVEVVGSWSDITDRKKLEEQFRQAQKMEAVGQLAGGVAHDFNNLLTVISGYSQLLLRSPELDDSRKGLVREIGKAGERAASLTRQLLAFSRKQVLEPKVLDLNALITEQKKMLSRLIGEDIELVTVLDPHVHNVKSDPGQLEQVIMNLVVNARDAMPHGGRLTLETHNVVLDETYTRLHAGLQPGSYAMVAVADTGHGMPAETLEHVFEPFFSTKDLGRGTGLGLATVYGIIKQSGGHVAVYSEVGIGTTFKIYLPSIAEPFSADEPAPDELTMPAGTETILLVEDEDAVRAIARHALESCGYRVVEAKNGAEALSRCEEHEGPIHLVVTDVVMPGMAGRALVDRLRVLRPDTRVLYVSGYTDDAVIRQGVLQAETAFLQKPFTPYALSAKVRAVLDQ